MPGKKSWVSFTDAKNYVFLLGLKNFSEWRTWSKSAARPGNIPTAPAKVYANEGWVSWGDWLGTNTRAKQNRTYEPFHEARQYARSLGLRSRTEWEKFRQSKNRPHDIPAKPDVVYCNHGWINWGDFLGTGVVAWRHRKLRPFLDARDFARSLNFKNQAEWYKFSKTDSLPNDIPSYPNEAYTGKGWISWGDWLGTGVIASQNREFRSFVEAIKFVRSLGLKNNKEWRKWSKSKARPSDIPTAPEKVYANKGWISWGNFLGTGTIGATEKTFKPFEDARIYVHSLGFKSRKEWEKWDKTNAKPNDIPSSPSITYKGNGWMGWGDWLGTGTVAHFKKTFKSFDEARIFARGLGLKGRDEWTCWTKTNERSLDIPVAPDRTYANLGWNGWGDFLATGNVSNASKIFKSFEEARNFVRSLQFANEDEWREWSKSNQRPSDIPSSPSQTYIGRGWQGWGDWLGTNHIRWTIDKLRLFVKSILPHIPNMPQMDRLVILQTRGIFFASKGKIIAQKILQADELTLKDLEKFANNQKCSFDSLLASNDMTNEDSENEIEAIASNLDPSASFNIVEALPLVETKKVLASVNQAVISGCDKETADFLVKSAVARIWKHAFEDSQQALSQVRAKFSPKEVYMKMVQEQFLKEYYRARELVIPIEYSFPFQPELMQRYTASLIKDRKRIGNWCGTGAGKTLASILASRVIEAQFTIICCPNNVIDTWKKEILKAFPNSTVIAKNIKQAIKKSSGPVYLIVNYEIFKDNNITHLLDQILSQQKVDFIIIDEIHYSKQRHKEKLTQRRKTLLKFLAEASQHNEQLHVLGMSATPVINNLYEGKTLIEMITGKNYDDLETRPTRQNCVSLYKQLILHGFRWMPDYKISFNLTPESFINCSWLLPDIIKLLHITKAKNLIKKKVLEPQPLEALLTRAKIPFILSNLRPFTIVYTYYVEDILIPLQEAIEGAGWRVGFFTGSNKHGLEGFLRKEIDILIVSNCAGTGLDGLQKVSNRIIINSLPWTHAEFKQLQGRILRKGQLSNHIDILVPLTFIEIDGKKWSWCESRWERIKFKKSIADAAVDGFLPEGMHITEQQAVQDAKLWLERMLDGKINEIIRDPIEVSLDESAAAINIRKLADLTLMNQKINQATSKKTNERFVQDPSQFYDYHNVYGEARKGWDVIPYKEAIAWSSLMPQWVIGDFGCGEAFLAKELQNKVYSFDHIAVNENVTACDMASVPLKNESLDAAIFSLSLMGTNFIDYLIEARRCLKLYGHLWMAEPTARIKDISLFVELLNRLGFDVYYTSQKGKFTFIQAIRSARNINCAILQEIQTQEILN